MSKKNNKMKIGRSAITGRFIPLDDAKRNPKTTVVETIPKRRKKR